MTINRVIVHEIIKEVNVSQASLDLSDQLLAVNSDSTELIKELNNKYSRASITYGEFDRNTGAVFPSEFDKYIGNMNDSTFIEFSKNAMQNLRNMICLIPAAKGGYIIFVDYEAHGHFIGAFLVRNTNGKIFNKDLTNNVFFINTAVHIDFEKLAMACRINYNTLISGESRYLSFIKKGNQDISQYFINWITCENKEDNVTDTKLFRQLVNEMPLPKDAAGNEISREQFMKNSYGYIKNRRFSVDIKAFGLEFYQDENYVIDYVRDNGIPITSEFQASKRILKYLINVSIKGDNIDLGFPRELLIEGRIKADQDKVIIVSRMLADKLRDELDNEQ